MLSELASLRRRALRKGVWFKVLSKIERSICDLTIRAISTIKSDKLLDALTTIVDKLKSILESPVGILTRTVGRQLASTLARIACSWGHRGARSWASDDGFARYLAVCYMNAPVYYRDQFEVGGLVT